MTKIEFEPLQSYECLSGCVCNFLRLWGHSINSSYMFFCGKGFDVKFRKDKGIRLSANVYDSTFSFLENCNIEVEDRKVEKGGDVEEILRKMLSEKRYICLKIASPYLKYNRVFSQNNSFHYIGVLDYESSERKFLIVDGFVPTLIPEKFLGWIDAEDVLSGWKKSDYNYIELYPTSSDTIEISLSRFRDEVICQLEEYLKERTTDADTVWGYKAVLAFLHEVVTASDDEMCKMTADANYQIRINGFLGARYYLKDALDTLLQNGEITEKINAVLSKWNSIGMALFKAGISKRRDLLEDVYKNAVRVVEEENELYMDALKRLKRLIDN